MKGGLTIAWRWLQVQIPPSRAHIETRADEDYMFLRNCWYAAAWSKDLSDQPLAKTFLNEKVVLFRSVSGQPAALNDKCCHRAAPLSRGVISGDNLVCGYHGLQFDTSGRCVLVPGQEEVPPGARVRSYPVHEQWNTVWIWMGNPSLADPAKIPELTWLNDRKWAITPGVIQVMANYQFIVDNLLDLTHVSYVHRNTLAGDPREATTPTKIERLANGVRVGRWMLDFVPPPLFAKAGSFTGNVDRWQFVTWTPPSTVFLDVGCAKAGTGAPEGDRSHGISIWSTHLITPQTAETSQYMFSYARDFALEDADMAKLLYEGSRATFMEDADILEAVQTNCDGGSLEGLIDISADAAQLQARRMLQRLISDEARGIAAE
jgi:phenylpropionate dioxygenase-like ring-hydroxylating dioxygenase large terminal subunit